MAAEAPTSASQNPGVWIRISTSKASWCNLGLCVHSNMGMFHSQKPFRAVCAAVASQNVSGGKWQVHGTPTVPNVLHPSGYTNGRCQELNGRAYALPADSWRTCIVPVCSKICCLGHMTSVSVPSVAPDLWHSMI